MVPEEGFFMREETYLFLLSLFAKITLNTKYYYYVIIIDLFINSIVEHIMILLTIKLCQLLFVFIYAESLEFQFNNLWPKKILYPNFSTASLQNTILKPCTVEYSVVEI